MHLPLILLLSLLSSFALALPAPTGEIDGRYNSTRAIYPLPRYDKTGKVQRRESFNPKTNACRISIYRDLYNQYHCDTECHYDYFNVEEVVVADNNSNERYATFPGINQNAQWRYQALDGHRGFQVFTKWNGLQDWYGFYEAYFHIEGHKSGDDRGWLLSFPRSFALFLTFSSEEVFFTRRIEDLERESGLVMFVVSDYQTTSERNSRNVLMCCAPIDMIHGGNCYYEGGSELWGQKGRAHCFLWCGQLNW
ncbi:hypothetical protein BKA65DRAFT_485185 [Rhexocercosporidium sp. MPI-PUGE-AT-0058]|nr:hypothetical protein BKA65DRAFT_485185 [Rhexocercosporidium sp. MPI-PUGE-AT-0058]